MSLNARIGGRKRDAESASAATDSTGWSDRTKLILGALLVAFLLAAYVLLIWRGLPTAEYVTLVMAPTLSVVVGFLLAGRIAEVKKDIAVNQRELVTVLSDQNQGSAIVAEHLAATEAAADDGPAV